MVFLRFCVDSIVQYLPRDSRHGRFTMADKSIRVPPMLWAQRKDKVWLTIQLENVKDSQIDLTDKKLHFKANGGHDNLPHEVDLEFYSDVIPEDSKNHNSGRDIIFLIKKKDQEAGYWPRLLKDTKKPHFLKTDFDKWKDEDDSDAEDNENYGLDDMMNQMGGFSPGDEDKENEEDSDDDDLPDLQ
ncbi:hypothetical protein SNE40_022289 [Patella caerulea]|uniref:CS domain-containing protein n=1 Tax=Patella caerulea TaxID=87958 RepID=A0AAN8IVL3_PATCE